MSVHQFARHDRVAIQQKDSGDGMYRGACWPPVPCRALLLGQRRPYHMSDLVAVPPQDWLISREDQDRTAEDTERDS